MELKGLMFPTRIDIPFETRMKAVDALNQTLALASDLRSQYKQAHWNLKGMSFISLHELFDKVEAALGDYVDTFAERAVALGGTAMGTVRMAAAVSSLPEFPTVPTGAEAYCVALAERTAMFNQNLRQSAQLLEEAGDPTTANYYLEVAMDMDKYLWMIESHIQV